MEVPENRKWMDNRVDCLKNITAEFNIGVHRSGRGTGRSINRGRGSGRGRGNITWPQPSALHTQIDTQPPHSNGQSTHLPTSQTPSNVQPSHSTPNPDISSAPSFSVPLGVTSGDGLHASPSRDNSYPKIGSKDSTDGRIWIRPGPKLTIEPSVQPTREITKIIKSKFEGCWANYGEIKKKNECLVELWYKEFQTDYEKRILERDTQETPRDDVSSHQSDNNIFLDVVGGVDKKGRVFGLGPEAGKYKPFVSSTSNGISLSEYEHMRAVISNLSAENMTLKDQLKTHEDLIRASQEESISTREESRLAREESRLLREQFQQFMKTFSLGQSHLPPCPDSTT